MTQIATQVKGYLDANIIISTCLMMNIMSLRALGRHICKELSLAETNLHAVVSGIRRYKAEMKNETSSAQSAFTGTIIKTKDNVVDIYLRKNMQVLEHLHEFKQFINFEQGDTFRIIQAEQGIRIITDEIQRKKSLALFRKENVVNVQRGLAEIDIQFSAEAVKTPGIVAMISASFHAGNVNIVEIMSCAPELILIVQQEDLTKSLDILSNLRKLQ